MSDIPKRKILFSTVVATTLIAGGLFLANVTAIVILSGVGLACESFIRRREPRNP